MLGIAGLLTLNGLRAVPIVSHGTGTDEEERSGRADVRVLPRRPQDRIRRPEVAEPAGVQALQSRRGRRRQDDEGAPAVLGRLLAHVQQSRCPTRSASARRSAPGTTAADSVANAQRKAKVAFEFIEKLGAPFYAFHDRDVAPEGKTLKESHANLDEVVKVLKDEQARTGVKLLWGTANLFSNPRYMHGAATSPNLDVFAYAAAQVKKAMEVTHELGGAGLHLLGGPRGLLDPAEHRHEARARPPRPVPPHGRRLQEADRLQRHVLHRAQAQGADQAPVRLRRRRLPELPPDLRPAAPLQAQPRDQPRHPRRPRDDARAGGRHRRRGPRLDRRQHRRPAARLGHRPVPDEHLPDDPVHALHPGHGRASPPAASTSTPRSAARASSRSTCSTPTSAAWTPSPAA